MTLPPKKAEIEPLSPWAKEVMVTMVEKILMFTKSLPTTTRCTDCKYLKGKTCEMWKSVVPDDVIATGCEKYDFDNTAMPLLP